MDSVERKLPFIQQYTYRIFIDSFDCKQDLLDSIGLKYLQTKNGKYLTALEIIHQKAGEKVEDLFTNIMQRFCEHDFTGLVQDLAVAKGAYYNLERELVATMNMIVDGHPLKQKYMGVLNVQITKAHEKKDYSAIYYWEKIKKRIDEEKY